jgi:hypothetical protein
LWIAPDNHLGVTAQVPAYTPSESATPMTFGAWTHVTLTVNPRSSGSYDLTVGSTSILSQSLSITATGEHAGRGRRARAVELPRPGARLHVRQRHDRLLVMGATAAARSRTRTGRGRASQDRVHFISCHDGARPRVRCWG